MDVKESEKTIRLKGMLQEALKPMTEKLEKLNEEVETVRKSPEKLQKMLEEIIMK
ncbi:hypothetical protein [Priestia megaterium]|uniref:hypothetical protein n=1 Tax=Priestia megaterium TaxID=1404 RepID=UPI0034E2AFC5